MKKILIIFMVLMSGIMFWTLYQEESHQEFMWAREVAEGVGEPFILIEDSYLMNYQLTLPVLWEAAEGLGVNILRTSQVSDELVQHFVLLTHHSQIFGELSLQSGHWLTVEESQRGQEFLSNRQTGAENQVGQLTFFGNRSEVVVAPLHTAFQTLPVAGQYFAELPEGITLEDFLGAFANGLNEAFEITGEGVFRAEEFMDSPLGGGMVMPELNVTWIAVGFLWVITFVLSVYYVASLAKKISILKLNGLGTGKIWSLMIGKSLILTFMGTTILTLGSAFLLGLRYQNFAFLTDVAMYQLGIYGLLLISSLGVCTLIKKIPIQQGVKNKNSTKFVFGLNTLIKMGLTVAVLVMGTVAFGMFQEIREQQAMFAGWAASSDYGVFPFLQMPNMDDRERAWEALGSEEFYRVLNEKGSLLINAGDYEAWRFQWHGDSLDQINWISDLGSWRNLRVNPNYLNAFPLYDINGDVVEISEDDERFILLIPESYQAQEEEILAHFQEVREWDARISITHYGALDSFELRHPEFEIIWLQNNQQVFSFHPNVFPENHNFIVDPFIQVITLANMLPTDRFLVGGGGARDPLKVRLTGQNPAATFEGLLPTLQALGLEGNLPPLVTVNEWALEQITNLQGNMNMTLLVGAVLFLIALGLSLQNLVLTFKQYKQKFIVNRVFGATFFGAYKKYFTYFTVTWLVQSLLAIFLALGFGMDFQRLVSLCLFFMGAEALLGTAMIQTLESKNKLAVLKGE